MNFTEDASTRIRVLVVDDRLMRATLSRIISTESGLEVVGTARSGLDALQKIAAADPDVVTLNVQMLERAGIETATHHARVSPASSHGELSYGENAESTFCAVDSGVFDNVPKQMSPASLDPRPNDAPHFRRLTCR